jgi:hypothetical protein
MKILGGGPTRGASKSPGKRRGSIKKKKRAKQVPNPVLDEKEDFFIKGHSSFGKYESIQSNVGEQCGHDFSSSPSREDDPLISDSFEKKTRFFQHIYNNMNKKRAQVQISPNLEEQVCNNYIGRHIQK